MCPRLLPHFTFFSLMCPGTYDLVGLSKAKQSQPSFTFRPDKPSRSVGVGTNQTMGCPRLSSLNRSPLVTSAHPRECEHLHSKKKEDNMTRAQPLVYPANVVYQRLKTKTCAALSWPPQEKQASVDSISTGQSCCARKNEQQSRTRGVHERSLK